ncbi:MAG: hypothetical protein ACTHN5_06495 [Phycisphaerae bacterium]
MPRVNYRQSAADHATTSSRNWFSDRAQMAYVIPLFAFVAVMLPGSFGTIAGINFTKLWFVGLPVV